MTDGPIERRLIEYIASELIIDDTHQVTGDDELLLDGLIDSIGATRLVGFVEDAWNIRVPPEDVTVENFGSVDQIARYLQAREVVSG